MAFESAFDWNCALRCRVNCVNKSGVKNCVRSSFRRLWPMGHDLRRNGYPVVVIPVCSIGDDVPTCQLRRRNCEQSKEPWVIFLLVSLKMRHGTYVLWSEMRERIMLLWLRFQDYSKKPIKARLLYLRYCVCISPFRIARWSYTHMTRVLE